MFPAAITSHQFHFSRYYLGSVITAFLLNMNLANQPDEVLVEALRQGKQQSLGVLYDRHGDLVFRLALRILNNTQDAEDLTQEIFLSFWKKGNFDPSRGSVPAFLLTMTRSRSLDMIRRRQSRQQMVQKVEKLHPTISVDTALEQASSLEIAEKVRTAMQILPENQRQLLDLAYCHGLTQAEISQQTGIPLGTVKTRTRQGLLKLRQLLQDLVG